MQAARRSRLTRAITPTATITPEKRVLSLKTVLARVPLSRTTLWRLERQGKFPTRIRLGLNSVGWRDEEVQHWVETRPRGMTQLDAFDREAQM